jgi:DNA polymerase-1
MDSSEFLDMMVELEQSKYLAVDVETTGLDLIDSEVVGIAFATQTKEWYVTPVDTAMWRMIGNGIFNRNHIMVAHNAPFDLYFIARECEAIGIKVDLNVTWYDTMAMAALVDENMIETQIKFEEEEEKTLGALSLKALSRVFLGRKQTVFPGVEEFAEWTLEQQTEYAKADVRNTYDLAATFSQILKSRDLLDYFRNFVAPMTVVTYAMEKNGVTVDIAKLLEVRADIDKELGVYLKQLQEIVPPTIEKRVKGRGKDKAEVEEVIPFNPNSTAQLGAYLTGKKYRLPLTETGRASVKEEVILELAEKYPNEPIFGPLLKMRKLEKLQGTYVDGILECAWEDNTVHPEWNQTGTVTGRYSASTASKGLTHKRGPAMQTIPTPDTMEDAGWAYNPREWFIAKPGNCLAIMDYSQAEVRMLAAVAQDPLLIATVNEGGDVHVNMAKQQYKKAWDEFDADKQKKVRKKSKTTTFGTMYGIGPMGLSKQLSITESEAEDLIRLFYDTFTGILDWKSRETTFLKRYLYVTTFQGRRRTPVLMAEPPRVTARPGTPEHLLQSYQKKLWAAEYDRECKKSGFDPQNVEDREKTARAVRQCINFEIQGSVAELINVGLSAAVREGYELLGQVHDEILIQIPNTEEDRERLKSFLLKTFALEIGGVKFKVDISFGYNWGCKN